ncbi:TetR/AcrR family transcriptional regulator [Aeromicrobium sp. CF3.5]|uniref:TetR/AcrR family transcriptional regulator n=1 Tax=Aeromicrobium sp. CF3.5 TaxID=3373078 RepID=UPI003EE6D608
MTTSNDRAEKSSVDKFSRRREELASAALVTLADRGYANTGLRDIADNSEFSHGVLHYYFTDKNDLLQQCVRQYKTDCATHYDDIVATSVTADELADRFSTAMAETLRDEASMHRLWYDLRNQSRFQHELVEVIRDIDGLLQEMIWKIVTRYGALSHTTVQVEPSLAYAAYDGMFEQSVGAFMSGDLTALDQVSRDGKRLLRLLVA